MHSDYSERRFIQGIADMADENEKIEKEEPPAAEMKAEEAPKADKVEEAPKAAKPEKAAKAEKAEKPDKAEKAEKKARKKAEGGDKKAGGAEKKGKDKGKAEEEKREFVPLTPPRALILYREKVVPQMMKEFGWNNRNRVPKIEKIIINIGIGDGARDIKLIESSVEDLRIITGQQPVITRARKSVAQYKIRTGMPVGLAVTLRGRRMYHFVDKLFNLALPRVRDFQGLNPNSFDGRGNFTMGLREQLVFPEIDYDKVSKVRGMDITIVTSARNDVEAASLLRGMGCPLRAN